MNDTFKHKGLRKKLIEEIKEKGIKNKYVFNEQVLKAIETVPRHLFLDSSFLEYAYQQDKAFKIGAGQTISQPYTVAVQSQLLEVKKGEKILEVGTGSGYQTSVLLELGAKVFTIERQKELFDKAKELLPQLGYHPKTFYGDGYKGLPSFAPFDKIIVTAGAPFVPEALLEQLKIGGVLVIPIGDKGMQVMTHIRKTTKNDFLKTEHGEFHFVPLLEEKQ